MDMTDALVSELRDVFRVDQGETLHPRHPKYLGNLAADAIARLTRERGEALEQMDRWATAARTNLDRAETAEAALSAARAELAALRAPTKSEHRRSAFFDSMHHDHDSES